MGEPIPPGPGNFETGAECEWCTYGDHAIFEPGKTPLYVQVDVYVGDEIVQTFIIPQSGDFPCDWGKVIIQGTWVWWSSTYGPTGVTILRIVGGQDNDPHISFNTFPDSTDKCATGLGNNVETEYRYGDYATITWNAAINQEAYEAQFE